MRNLNKILLAAAMVVASTFALANDVKPNVKVERSGAKAFAVIACGNNAETQIKLISENGSTIYSASSQTGESFGKRLDLNNLPAGMYALEVENRETYSSTPIKIGQDSAFVNAEEQITIIKPVINQNGEKIDIILPEDADAVTMISIYDAENRRLVKEALSTEGLKRFDLSKLEKGAYTVRFQTKGKYFMQSVSIK